MRPDPRVAPRLAALTLATVLAAAFGCALGESTERPNVVLIVLDTTRPDRLSLYGYPRPTTPTLESLAQSSTVYDAAYSTSSWTPPAHASLFTGLLPRDHGVTQTAWDLPGEQVTLAEQLWQAGYETLGIVGNPMVGRQLGFDQGFEHYYETWRYETGPQHPAIRRFGKFLERRSDRPFLAFFNLNEPHNPYDSPHYRDAFVGPNAPDLVDSHWREVFRGSRTLSAEEVAHLGDLYDAELRYVDDLVAEIIEQLEQREILDDTVVVITSDHGENLGEHGLLDHVFSLYETTVRVPLLVRYPQAFAAAQRVSRPVQLVDVHATLTALAGLDSAASRGVDLRNDTSEAARPILLSYDYPRQVLRTMGPGWQKDPRLSVYKRRLFALREGNSKLILGSDGLSELYDLSLDPGEEHDLAGAQPERLAELRERIDTLLVEPAKQKSPRNAPRDAVDPATLEELRILGYAE